MTIKFRLTPAVKSFARRKLRLPVEATDNWIIRECAKAVAAGTITETKLAALCGTQGAVMGKKTPAAVVGSGIRVKGASERYSTKRAEAKHVKTGQPVEYGGKPVERLSEVERAKAGAWVRFCLLKGGMSLSPLTDHEKALVAEMFEKDAFHVGQADQNGNFQKMAGPRVKALLSDGTSGGIYANPYFFDDAFITYPLLHSELLPNVDLKDIPASNRIESFSLGNVTASWGTPEGTAITPFDTAGLVGEISASTFPLQVAVECGRDWLNDSPVAVGDAVVEVVGQRMLAELDKAIADGDGTTEPQGLTNASGFTAINSDNGAGGPPTVGDAENLIFAVPLQYRRRTEWNPAFVMNDTSYRRFRGIPVSPTDERRVFGNAGFMGTEDSQRYQLFEYPVKISADLPNSKVIFAALKKYRLWRRQGFEIRWSDVGSTLKLANKALLVVRGRFAGKLLDANAMAMTADMQS